MPKKDKIEKLVKDLKLNDKERRSYEIRAKKLHPKRIKDNISRFAKAVTSYGKILEEIKNREWDPETKSIEIPLEGGGKKLMMFKTEEEFNIWKQADMDAVSKHIEHDKDEVKKYQILKKFKEVL